MSENFVRPQLVSGTLTFGPVSTTVHPVGHYRSAPAEIATPCPSPAVKPAGSRQHPVPMTLTVGAGVVAKEAANDSSLVTECPPESSADRAQE